MPAVSSAVFRRRIASVKAEVKRRLEARYGGLVDIDDIEGSLDSYIAAAEPLIAAGQATVVSLTEAFLGTRAARAGIELALDDVVDPVGTTRAGEDLNVGMAAFGPMILAQIAKGSSADDAIDFGRYLATRFADAEITGAVDRIEQDPVVRRHVAALEGTVQPGACEPCQANAGRHEPDWEPYRHPGCDCVVEVVFGAVG